jgi:hypothetical protein
VSKSKEKFLKILAYKNEIEFTKSLKRLICNGPALSLARVSALFHYHPLIMKHKSKETMLNYKTPR